MPAGMYTMYSLRPSWCVGWDLVAATVDICFLIHPAGHFRLVLEAY
jgi:hypothetical protein